MVSKFFTSIKFLQVKVDTLVLWYLLWIWGLTSPYVWPRMIHAMVSTLNPWMTPRDDGGVVVDPLDESEGAAAETKDGAADELAAIGALLVGSSSSLRIDDPFRTAEKQTRILIHSWVNSLGIRSMEGDPIDEDENLDWISLWICPSLWTLLLPLNQ